MVRPAKRARIGGSKPDWDGFSSRLSASGRPIAAQSRSGGGVQRRATGYNNVDPKQKFKDQQLVRLIKPRSIGGASLAAMCKRKMAPVEQRKQLEGVNTKCQLHKLNTEIAECAKARNIGEAIRVFRQLILPRHKPTDVTYGALINAFVRTNDVEKALLAYYAMQLDQQKLRSLLASNSSGAALANDDASQLLLPPGVTLGQLRASAWLVPPRPVVPTVIVMTTVIKGLANEGRLEAAWRLLYPALAATIRRHSKVDCSESSGKDVQEAAVPEMTLRARTINSFLRGCVRSGDVGAAWLTFLALRSVPGAVTTANIVDAATVSALVKLLCHAFLVIKAEQVLSFYKKTGLSQGNKRADDSADVDFWTLTAEPYICLATAAVALARRDKATKYLREADRILETSRVKGTGGSNEPFLEHRQSEFRRDVGRLWGIVRKAADDEDSSPVLLTPEPYMRLFYFPGYGSRVPLSMLDAAAAEMHVSGEWAAGDNDDVRGMCLAATANSKRTHNLEAFGWNVAVAAASANKASGTSDTRERSVVDEDALLSRIRKGQLKLSRVFGTKKSFHKQNVCLELCSGSGDWVVQQAKKARAFWLASELRFDRAHCIFQKAAGLRNLCVIGGDGRHLIENLLPAHSLKCVYINFPEPPPYFDHPGHLLSKTFFIQLRRVLRTRGKVYVVSDNVDYLHLLVELIKSLATHFTFADGRLGVISGVPKGFGKHTSYFDRFWDNGKRLTRGHISLRAVEVTTSVPAS